MKAVITFLLILIGCSACDTPGSMPDETKPLVLKTGWTYYPGDHQIAELPATGGVALDPWEDVFQFRAAYPPPSVGWLSSNFTVPANWPKQPLALTILQSVASEVYLDKQLIAKYGTIGNGSQKTHEHDPLLRPIPLALTPGSVHSLDVKIALAANTKYTTLFESPNPVFQAELKPFDNALHEHTRIHTIETAFLRLNAGINLMLFVVHFFFFLLNRNQVANLFLSLAAFSNILGTLLQLEYFLYTPYHTDKFFLGNTVFLFYQSANLMLFFAIHHFLERRKDIIYWFLLTYFFVALVLNASWYDLGWRAGGAIFQIMVFLNILRICGISIRQNKKGALVFFTGAAISLICFITFALLGTFDTETHFLRKLSEFRYLIYMLSWLGITGSVSAFLALDFSLTSKQLSLKLAEVNELSEKNLAVEKEKQEILASQNLQLEQKVEARTRELNQSLENLKATQAQLIQAEKMASLGELTAGIAHEIQNPLNFVNNFSQLNTELVAEALEAMGRGEGRDAEDILHTVAENENKILQHGKRADSIVKGMLQHSRTSSGVKEPTDINALAEEYLRLAFHGLRAKDKSFNSDYIFTPDPDLAKVNVVPQDIGRVILNLINNAFYAVHERAKSGEQDYKPCVELTTEHAGNKTVFTVRDNGKGIPAAIRNKIFQPFFTTKPTGEGTGLGLSLSYDIVKAHGGELKLHTTEGVGTEFILELSN
ncbi:MAG TPA: ATP-binding protein [Chitinophagaceae bacterium]|nr:ATP-binding protein [Chitinophagaceae bacterium]